MSEGHSFTGAGEGGKNRERASEAARKISERARGSLGISSSSASIAPKCVHQLSALAQCPWGREVRKMYFLCIMIKDSVTGPPSLIIVWQEDVTTWQCKSYASPNKAPQSGVNTITVVAWDNCRTLDVILG